MKIVSAVNAIILNKDRITNVINGIDPGELFFEYDNKYKWSITRSDNTVKLWLYPTNMSLENLASMDSQEWQEFNQLIYYNAKDIGTIEAKESFEELYRLIKEKEFGADIILDDIVASAGLT